MHNAFSAILGLIAPLCLAATISNATAAPPAKAAEERYVAARDAAIEKFSKIQDGGTSDDATRKAEDAVRADLLTQMKAMIVESARKGFGPAKLNLDTFYRGDEGFGALDGLRFDAELGDNGEKAGENGRDGKYVEPRAHIIITTQTLFERWLREHKEWWDKGVKNVPQQIGAALRAEGFSPGESSGSAVVSFNALPISKLASTTFSYAMLARRTQCEIPAAADQVFVSALANGKAYIVLELSSRRCRSRPVSRSGPTSTRRPKTPTSDLRPARAAAAVIRGRHKASASHAGGGDGKIMSRAQLARASAGRVWRSSFAQTKPSAIMMAPAVSKVGTLPACWMPKP